MGEPGQLTAHRARQGLELRGGHIDACEALQAEGVPTRQKLGSFKDVIIGAEANSTLSVLHIIFRVLDLLPAAPSFSSVRLLTPSTLPPLSMVLLSFSPPPSLPPLRISTS